MNIHQYPLPALIKHIKKFVSGKQAVLLLRNTLFALTIYEESKQKGVYDSYGRLKKRILAGSYVRHGARQRRIIHRYYPIKEKKRPRKDEVRIFISLLASAYAQASGQPVTQNYRDQHLAPFEVFCTPIFDMARIADTHGWITKHIQSRDTLSRTYSS